MEEVVKKKSWFMKPVEVVRYYAGGLFKEFMNKAVLLWAQAIAFKVLIALGPILILVTGLAGQILRRERPFRYIETLIRDYWPSYRSEELITFLGQIQEVAGTLTLVGSLTLIVTSVTLFSTLRNVLTQVFREEWHDSRSILGGYVFDLRMAVQVGLFFVATILLTILTKAFRSGADSLLHRLGMEIAWLQEGWHLGFDLFALLLPFLLSAGMFFQLYYLTPTPHPPVKSAISGAVFAALLWETTKVAFTVYAGRIASFESSWTATLGDTFILIIVIVLWAYLSGVVLILGALTTLLYERRHRLARDQSAEIPLRKDAESVSYSVTVARTDED